MNVDKAKELFSEYREGSLSPSLRESLSRALQEDLSLAREYNEFDSLMAALESSAGREAEVPFDLHDKIMARVDKGIFDASRTARSGRWSTLRLGLVGAAACVAIVSTVFAIKNQGNGRESTGTVVNIPTGSAPKIEIAAVDGVLTLRHAPSESVVVVKEEASGRLLYKFDLQGNGLNSPVTNDGPNSVLVRIESDQETTLVALPGRSTAVPSEGKGTLKDLAKVMADLYRSPVKLGVADSGALIAWSLDSEDPLKGRAKEGSFTVDRRGGLLFLTN